MSASPLLGRWSSDIPIAIEHKVPQQALLCCRLQKFNAILTTVPFTRGHIAAYALRLHPEAGTNTSKVGVMVQRIVTHSLMSCVEYSLSCQPPYT